MRMEWWEDIRRRVLVAEESKRSVMRDTGIHWDTLQKVLNNSTPPGYQRSKAWPQPKLGPYLERIAYIIDSDKGVHKKQRHTAKRIFERLQEEGYTGGYTQVKEAIRAIKQKKREVFVPLIHRPGEAQMDFGHALVNENGHLKKVIFFVMCLPYSDAVYIQVFDRICTEVMLEGHIRAFAFFGGVPCRISYDNDRVLVARILGARDRKLTQGFLSLKSHYLFDHHFCLVRRPNEKGVVESMVRYTRSNFLVPIPCVRSLSELNKQLHERCKEELKRKVRGQKFTKAELLKKDKAMFKALPDRPLLACKQRSTTSSSLSLVRFDKNDYSVPVRYAHHTVVVKGYTDHVEICYLDKRIARHKRIWDREEVSFEPLHYLPLLERKPGALDHARPLYKWDLPECFGVLRRRLENEYGGEGTREYISVLRLLEKYSVPALRRAIDKALRINALKRDAIAQFLLPREDYRLTSFSLDGREHLRRVRVLTANISAYNNLLTSRR